MSQEPECPECGEEMVKRVNGNTQEEFWGCPLWPVCDGHRSMTPKPDYPDWASDPNQ